MGDVWANGIWAQSHLPHCRVLPPGEFNGISQSHVSHCRVLPLDEFTVMIPEPHATLQGAVTWRNQCHDRATLQGVRIAFAILKIVFSPYCIYFFVFIMQFRLWWSAAFVSSPIHWFDKSLRRWYTAVGHCVRCSDKCYLDCSGWFEMFVVGLAA